MPKHVLYGFKPFEAVDASQAQVSEETTVGQFDKLTYQCKFSEPASGTFVVEAKSQSSKDPNGKDTEWYALDFGGPMTITAETDVVINLTEVPFNQIRISWSGDGANSGTLDATLAAKAVGA